MVVAVVALCRLAAHNTSRPATAQARRFYGVLAVIATLLSGQAFFKIAKYHPVALKRKWPALLDQPQCCLGFLRQRRNRHFLHGMIWVSKLAVGWCRHSRQRQNSQQGKNSKRLNSCRAEYAHPLQVHRISPKLRLLRDMHPVLSNAQAMLSFSAYLSLPAGANECAVRAIAFHPLRLAPGSTGIAHAVFSGRRSRRGSIRNRSSW